MKQVWKWVMHLNAKAFCSVATVLFFCTVGYCMFMYMTPPEPIKDGSDNLPDAPKAPEIGILDYVARQLDGDDLFIPLEPFRPTMDAILMNPEQLSQFLTAMNTPRSQNGNAGKNNPFQNVRNPGSSGGAGADGAGAGEPKMITPKITFPGFFKRSDGTSVAMFTDSTDKSKFYTEGEIVHGLEILGADMRKATVRYPDGTVREIRVGDFVELTPEPDPNPPTPDAKK
ncbi:MAG: hypothetical protein FWH21_04535 [Kiritimatiellaeota bacterium]|nr:hypothetical protein [Kiritimatiellota bacterium]